MDTSTGLVKEMRVSQVFRVLWGLLIFLIAGLPVAGAASDATIWASLTEIPPTPTGVTVEPEPSGSPFITERAVMRPGYPAGFFDASTVGPLPSTLIIIILGIITLVLTRQRR